ncbi:MAG: LTA synthase family protein [Clostridia bacterium]|nr:LTA synthase family protein [Clostridia bacterium]
MKPSPTKKLTAHSAGICLLVTLLLFFKSYLFYSHVNLAGFHPLFALLTAAIFLFCWTVLHTVSERAAKIVMFTAYTILSVFMAIDAVYYSYVSKMPSIAMLPMIWQATGIADTILRLLKPYHMAMLIDLPLWCMRAADSGDDKIRENLIDRIVRRLKSVELKKSAAYAVSFALCLCVLVTACVWTGFEPEYMANELFCYHLRDFYTVVRDSTSDRIVDKSLYTAKSQADSEYFGIAKDRNVIVLQVEAMQNFVIGAVYEGQEITPNLNRLIGADTFYFDNYYYQIGGGNTSDAEFAVNNSLFAPESEAAYVKYTENTWHGLPYLLKDHGYSGAYAFHNYVSSFWNRETAYPYQGFDSFTSLEDFEQDDMFPMGLSDKSMFRQSMEQLKTFEEPFYAFYVTVSSHHPYAIPLKDREIVLKPEDEGTLFGLYLQSMNYADRAIGEFIEQLDEAGLYENSVIAVYGDHYALANTDPENSTRVAALTDGQYSIFDVFNVPFIVHVPGCGYTETKSAAGGHIDVMPTLLCLLGIDNDKTVMFGQNLLEAETGFVCEQTHVAVGSFISDEVYFKKPYNNIKANYDAYSRADMSRMDPDLFKEQSDYAKQRILDCAELLADNDILLP